MWSRLRSAGAAWRSPAAAAPIVLMLVALGLLDCRLTAVPPNSPPPFGVVVFGMRRRPRDRALIGAVPPVPSVIVLNAVFPLQHHHRHRPFRLVRNSVPRFRMTGASSAAIAFSFGAFTQAPPASVHRSQSLAL